MSDKVIVNKCLGGNKIFILTFRGDKKKLIISTIFVQIPVYHTLVLPLHLSGLSVANFSTGNPTFLKTL